MEKINKFDIQKLKGKLSDIRDWMKDHHFPPKLLFYIMGIISTIWFLIRVIPKPSRANYPCMQVAAPLMSGFVVYLLSLGGVTLALRKAKQNIFRARYIAAGSFIVAALVCVVISIVNGIQDSHASTLAVSGPEDGPNQPIGKAKGIIPGRVVWVWDPKATNEKCVSTFATQNWYFKPENTDQKVVSSMFRNAINKLSGKKSVAESWDGLFRYHNNKKYHNNKGYTKGEKIFIKINQGTSRWLLTQEDKDNGYYYPTSLKPWEMRRAQSMAPTETGPYIILEILRELVNEMGVNQADISVGDPMTDIYGHNYDVWVKEFPDVKYIDKFSTMHGRTMIKTTEKVLLFYSDKKQSDKLYDVIENADYLINVANFKPHVSAGVTLTAKNHFGSQGSDNAAHLHYALLMPRNGVPTNGGYHKYRVLVDLMGSKYLGENTLLYMVDGLFGGGASETKPPVKYFMAPFNNDWCNSMFLSLDQVALESVCYDFLRTEWNGINKHDNINNVPETGPNMNGVDDYLHQAADSSNWPANISYDPDNSGKPLSSLGVHEHWNNDQMKQYSRNLGFSKGIELVSIPDSLVKTKSNDVPSTSKAKTKSNHTATSSQVKTKSNDITSSSQVKTKSNDLTSASKKQGLPTKAFYAALVDDNNIKWFLTEQGIISFDDKEWTLHDKNKNVPTKNIKGFAYETSSNGSQVFIATPFGATAAMLPIDTKTGTVKYNTKNSAIKSDSIHSIAIGKNSVHWFGTEKGISAFYNNKWLKDSYQDIFPDAMFKDTPITIMASNPEGDTLYVGTEGAGVARVFRNDVDAISGASEYAQWGPILLPSDKIYSMLIAPNGLKWFGTDLGVSRHIGSNTLEKWTTFTTKEGLINNFVQAIAIDNKGNTWFGTKGGVSVYDGSAFASFTAKDGLASENVLCIIVDKKGIVWLGTDKGVTSFNDGKFTNYN
jgi:ligand-binding sensor domain-containing protein